MRLLFSVGIVSVGLIRAASGQELKAADTKKYPVYDRGGFAVKIDAKLDDWDMAKVVLLMDEKTWEPLGGSRDNDKDITARLRVLYDTDNLYFATEVDDDEYVANAATPWENDGVQIAIDATAGKIAAGWPNTTTHLYNFSIKDGWQKEAGPFLGDAEIQMKRDDATKKTYFEWRMPTEILAKKGTVLKAGMEIAYAMIVNDSDKNAPGQTGWVGWGNQTIVFGKNPEEMQTLVLEKQTLAVDPSDTAAVFWAALKGEK
jgi:hypothetical protein